jgi:hypothetical protein
MTGESFTPRDLADAVAGGNLAFMATLLNDVREADHVLLDENEPDPQAIVSRDQVVALRALLRAGTRIGRRLARLLGRHPRR